MIPFRGINMRCKDDLIKTMIVILSIIRVYQIGLTGNIFKPSLKLVKN